MLTSGLYDLGEIISDATVDRQQLIGALEKPLIKPGRSGFFTERYLKYDLEKMINEALGVNVHRIENLYSALNKEPMKRIGYGLLNCKEIPKELFRQMGELGPSKGAWLMAYYAAGVFNIKCHEGYDRLTLLDQPLSLHVLDTAASGVNLLRSVHKKMTGSGKYRTEIRLPYFEEVYLNRDLLNDLWQATRYEIEDCELTQFCAKESEA